MENVTMSNSSVHITANIVFNLLSAVLDILAVLICVTFFCLIIYRLVRVRHNRRLVTTDVPLILSINIICVIFVKSTLQIIHVTFPTIMKDFDLIVDFKETPLFRYRAYMLWSINGILFWSYNLLAFFSFVRVVYPRKVWLYRATFYKYVLIPGQFLCVFISLLPLLFIFDSLHQIPNEAYCSIASTPIYSLLYTEMIGFILPMNVMCGFYICIARKLKQTLTVRENLLLHRRDLIVIRRILSIIVTLNMLSIPYLILFIINLIENNLESVLYRVQWISSSTGSCLFSITLPLTSTRLRHFLRSNRLAPENR